jgi:hypothetical protein
LKTNENKLQHARHENGRKIVRPISSLFLFSMRKELEATAGIEPACTDLQSAASPLRHVANRIERASGGQAYIALKAIRQS